MKLSSFAISVSVSLFICVVVFCTFEDYGITWDEPTYINAGKKYIKWLSNPSIETLDEHWGQNREHPPLAKVLGGLTNCILHNKLGLFNEATSYRISILIFIFFLNFSLFLFVSEIYGDRIAFIVTIAFSFMPRVFFHSHIGALDYPMTAMWFLVIFTYWKGLKDQRWLICSSIIMGLALLTKINAFFLYVPISLYLFLVYKKEIIRGVLEMDRSNRVVEKIIISKLIPMIVIPLFIFICFWPWLWKDTINRFLYYFLFHINHVRVPVYYFGNIYYKAPWEYPLLLTLISIPIFFLVLFFAGILKNNVKYRRDTTLIILFNALFPLFIISISRTKYDGIRLFLPAFPFIAIIAGIGSNNLFRLFKSQGIQKIINYIYALLFLVTVYFSTVKYHPYQASYFNMLIGGVNGACEAGFEPEYWGSSYKEILPWLEGNEDNIFWIYMNSDPFYYYRINEMLNPKIIFGGRDNSDYIILLSRFGMFNEDAWKYFTDEEPVFSVRVLNTQLAGIYRIE